MKAIRVHRPGPPEVLEIEDTTLAAPIADFKICRLCISPPRASCPHHLVERCRTRHCESGNHGAPSFGAHRRPGSATVSRPSHSGACRRAGAWARSSCAWACLARESDMEPVILPASRTSGTAHCRRHQPRWRPLARVLRSHRHGSHQHHPPERAVPRVDPRPAVRPRPAEAGASVRPRPRARADTARHPRRSHHNAR